MSAEAPAVGLRERKKQQTRQKLLDASEALFKQRGYDNVTVAEVADAASISVKTFFTYFRSKEDLAFADERLLLEQILDAVRSRPLGTSPVDAVGGLLADLIAARGEGVESLRGYHRMVGDSQALSSRLLRMWSDYEDELAALLSAELRDKDAPAWARLAAMQLVAVVRSLASEEVLALADRYKSDRRRRAAVEEWVRTAVAMVRDGVDSGLAG